MLYILGVFLLAIPWVTPAGALPRVEVVDFDVPGNGIPNPALKITGIDRAGREPFRLSQLLDLQADENYCATFDLAVRNDSLDLRGRYRFEIQLGSHNLSYLTPVVPRDSTFRDQIRLVVHNETAGPAELNLDLQHDLGPVEDPALYLDNFRIRPLANERLLVASDPETLWVSGSTVVGWQYDFGLQGLSPQDVIGSAVVDFVVWDDPEPIERSPEIVEITINGQVLWRQDIAGSMEFPWLLALRLSWLECKAGFDGFLQWRLRTVPGGGWPAGSLFFGGATARFEVGDWGPSVVHNGFFAEGLEGWLCNGAACGTVHVEHTSWSRLKQLYR